MTTNRLPIATAPTSEVTLFDAERAKAVDLLKFRDTSPVFEDMVLRLATSAIRHTLRDQDCDMIPKIEGLFALPHANQWGDSLLLEVTYAKCGWRASYGGRFDDAHRHIIWTCYAN